MEGTWRGLSVKSLANAVLAAAVVAIVGTMLVPLPTALLDVLLASNLSLAAVVLLVSLYASTGLELSAFPTLLLVTTLYRLALNISTTRLILLQADAGAVVAAFGDFVVQGSYVVGAVVFAIITLVQFVVIARGSERVAEVGARFALDAMPGKQMSIDGEQRSGAITREEASHQRRTLERESQLYGAMDGAMKFVKGDAIAGLAIIVINLIGGLGVGVGVRGMSFSEALELYGVLTIGDGLVSQLPALLIATGAGVVVTRVSSEREQDSLAADLGRQLFGRPRPLLVAGVFLVVLALVPGLPPAPFLFLGATLLAIGGWALWRQREAEGPLSDDQRSMSDSLAIEVPKDQRWLRRRLVEEALPELRERLLESRGLALPAVAVRTVDGAKARVLLRGTPVAVLEPRAEDWPQLRGELHRVVFENAARLVDMDLVQRMLDRLGRTHPATIQEAVPVLGLAPLTRILRRLAEEQVRLRPLESILETLAADPTGSETERVERARRSIRVDLCAAIAKADGSLPLHTLDPMIEEAIRDGLRESGGTIHLALAPELADDIRAAIVQAEAEVLLVADDLRPYVYDLLAPTPTMVLSYSELDPAAHVRDLGRIMP